MELPNIQETADSIFFSTPHRMLTCENTIATSAKYYFAVWENEDLSIKYNKPWEDFYESLFSKIDSKPGFEPLRANRKHTKGIINLISKNIFAGSPNSFNIQPTYDGSLLFTFTDGDIQVHLEYFINHKVDDIDEVVITFFSDKKLINTFFGTLKDGLKSIDNTINNITLQQFEVNASAVSERYITTRELSLY